MLIIKIENKDKLERALKNLKKKFEKTGVMKQLKARKSFEKPSVTKRAQKLKAIYIAKLKEAEEQQ
jgi:small subunit ribosomal protein S21